MPATNTIHVMDAYPRKGWMVGEMIHTTTGREIRHTRLEARTLDEAAAEAQRRWPDAEVIVPGKPAAAKPFTPVVVPGTPVEAMPAPARRMLESVGLA